MLSGQKVLLHRPNSQSSENTQISLKKVPAERKRVFVRVHVRVRDDRPG